MSILAVPVLLSYDVGNWAHNASNPGKFSDLVWENQLEMREPFAYLDKDLELHTNPKLAERVLKQGTNFEVNFNRTGSANKVIATVELYVPVCYMSDNVERRLHLESHLNMLSSQLGSINARRKVLQSLTCGSADSTSRKVADRKKIFATADKLVQFQRVVEDHRDTISKIVYFCDLLNTSFASAPTHKFVKKWKERQDCLAVISELEVTMNISTKDASASPHTSGKSE